MVQIANKHRIYGLKSYFFWKCILKQLAAPFIDPYFIYCAPVWDGLRSTLGEKSQRLQNRAARVIMGSTHDISSSSLLGDLGLNRLSLNGQK